MNAIIFILLLSLASWRCAFTARAEGKRDINVNAPVISPFKTRRAELRFLYCQKIRSALDASHGRRFRKAWGDQ